MSLKIFAHCFAHAVYKQLRMLRKNLEIAKSMHAGGGPETEVRLIGLNEVLGQALTIQLV